MVIEDLGITEYQERVVQPADLLSCMGVEVDSKHKTLRIPLNKNLFMNAKLLCQRK